MLSNLRVAVRFTNQASLTLALLGISDTRPASQSSVVITRSLGLGLRKFDEKGESLSNPAALSNLRDKTELFRAVQNV